MKNNKQQTVFSRMYPFVKLLRSAKNIIGRIIPENSWLFCQLVLLGLKFTVKQRLAKPELLNLQIPTTTHCNLKCAYCSAFSSIADKEFYAVESLEKDMSRLAELTQRKAGFIAFAGGEPLLHPELTRLFDIARNNFPEALILVQTNGTLLEKQSETFWKSCRKNNIAIEITRYPIGIPIEALKNLGQLHGVEIEYFGGKIEPIKTMWKFTLDLQGRQNIQKTFRLCPISNRFGFLYNGKIGCDKCITIRWFNAYFHQNLTVTEDDYLDIYKITSTDEILEYLRNPIPFCKYCDWQHLQTGLKWKVSKGEISEWV